MTIELDNNFPQDMYTNPENSDVSGPTTTSDIDNWNHPDYKKGYKGSDETIDAYFKRLASYNEDSGEFNPYDVIDQSMYKNTARGRMAYNEDLAKLLYLAQINQENRMNEYNSPAEQAKRMREAGLNPDLLGVENMPASNVAGYTGNPTEGLPTNLQNTSDVFGIISSATNILGSIVGGAQSIFANPLGLASSALQLFEQAPTGVMLSDFINSSRLPRRTKRRLNAMYNSYMDSARYSERDYQEASAVMLEKANFHRLFNNPYIRPSFDGVEGGFDEYKAFTDALAPLIKLENDVMFKELNARFNQAGYNQGRYNYQEGVDQRDYEKTQRDMYRSLRKPIIETIDNLKALSNQYPWATWAQGAVAAAVLGKLNF